jgi:hypothetical protein
MPSRTINVKVESNSVVIRRGNGSNKMLEDADACNAMCAATAKLILEKEQVVSKIFG